MKGLLLRSNQKHRKKESKLTGVLLNYGRVNLDKRVNGMFWKVYFRKYDKHMTTISLANKQTLLLKNELRIR